MQKISVQSKKNLKQRVARLITGFRETINIPFNFRYVGSIKKPGSMKLNSDGFYDIDIDILVSTRLSAQETYNTIKKALKPHIRDHELVKSKRNAVIVVMVDSDGYKYKIDIAIFNLFGNNEVKMMKDDKNSYVWQKQ